MNKQIFAAFLEEVPSTTIALIFIAGILFGIAYTYIHFWSIKKFVMGSANMKGALFLSTLVRLGMFFGALLLVSYPNHPGIRVMIFFVGFMVGRIPMLRYSKKELKL